ncbi:hypothetical protein ACXWR7_10025, partial [Streptococcus pyogenes]
MITLSLITNTPFPFLFSLFPSFLPFPPSSSPLLLLLPPLSLFSSLLLFLSLFSLSSFPLPPPSPSSLSLLFFSSSPLSPPLPSSPLFLS